MERVCPGLRADWLNGWLAAIGATVLSPDLTLRWTDDPTPLAVLGSPVADPTKQLGDAWPEPRFVDDMPLTRRRDDCKAELSHNISDLADFAERANVARGHNLHWTLTSFYADACVTKTGPSVEKAPFLAPMPGSANTMFDRVKKVVAETSLEGLEATLCGTGERVQQNGLGFDVTRIGSTSDKTDMFIDPNIELLAFFGLSMFPARGNGGDRIRQRGWGATRTKVGDFQWAAWSPPLDLWAIDAALDVFYREPLSIPEWITARYELVPFQARGSSDATRGFGSRQVP